MNEKVELVSKRKQETVELVATAGSFMVACVVGSGAIAAGVWFNSLELSVGGPVLVMLVYIFGSLTWQNDLPTSVIGDSFYYLGFILTLVALAASLVSLATNDSIDMNKVIGSFGAALITTIIGLVARLVVTSFSVQSAERRERLEQEIERSIISLSKHLEVLTSDVVASIAKVHAESEQTLRDTVSGYESIHNEMLDQYKQSMTSGESAVKESMINLASRIDDIEVSPDLIARPLTSTLGEITATLTRHNEKYAEVNSSLAESNAAISSQFDKTTGIIQGHVSRLEATLSDTIEKQTQMLAQSIQKLAEPIETSSRELQKSSAGIGKELDKVIDANEQAENFLKSAQQTSSTVSCLNDNLEQLGSVIETLSNQLREVSEVSTNASTSIAAAARATESSSSQVAKDISEVYQQLTTQIKTLKGIA